MSSTRALCIHGHFYQPPRENPWLEAIEQQDSAYPMHDWNERVHAECYRNNAASRVLDEEGRVRAIVNNYARMSFNFGPTLLSWMEVTDPATYQAILAADRASRARFGGHGCAIAQVYNHIIMPLANRRDKVTQVRWGIADFRRRFERFPEGMWLAETAVDTETLEVLAEHGISFTILAPGQAARVRAPHRERWQEVGHAVDPRRPYLVNLPSGRSIAVFFYDGGLSQAVAFQGLLSSGDRFADTLLSGFDDRPEPQLVHIATDGESYGHHHRYGDMALAYALERIDANPEVELTNYGQFLANHPPVWEAEIVENTSWSCYHGVERWRSDCGCRLDGRAPTNQRWREPLRRSLNLLRDRAADLYEHEGRRLLRDPWAARNAYINVIAARGPQAVQTFLADHATEEGRADPVATLRMLELQRHALLMFTSCGWFFDDVSRIEAVQVLAYAGRVLDLGRDLGATAWEEAFLSVLEEATSNLVDEGNGRDIYNRYVRPLKVDREKVIAHYAVSSIFDPYAEDAQIYAYDVEQHAYEAARVGLGTMAVGHAKVTSRVTLAAGEYTFAVWHFGDHNLIARVQAFSPEHFERIQRALVDAARRGDAPVLLREMERGFTGPNYSLQALLKDQQRKILSMVLGNTESELEMLSAQLYDRFAPLARFLAAARFPLPKPLQAAAEFVLNTTLRSMCEAEPLDVERIQSLLEEARAAQVELDTARVGLALQGTLERAAQRWESEPDSEDALADFARAARLLRSLPFEVDLFVPQNLLYRQLRRLNLNSVDRQGDWWRSFRDAAQALRIAIPEGT